MHPHTYPHGWFITYPKELPKAGVRKVVGNVKAAFAEVTCPREERP
jgi:hypothetical protein